MSKCFENFVSQTLGVLTRIYAAELRKSITTDNGLEFANHKYITKKLGVTVYFTDPYSSWQKGAIENINGLIRQYIPKSTCFDDISHQYVAKITDKINLRPKKIEFSYSF